MLCKVLEVEAQQMQFINVQAIEAGGNPHCATVCIQSITFHFFRTVLVRRYITMIHNWI